MRDEFYLVFCVSDDNIATKLGGWISRRYDISPKYDSMNGVLKGSTVYFSQLLTSDVAILTFLVARSVYGKFIQDIKVMNYFELDVQEKQVMKGIKVNE